MSSDTFLDKKSLKKLDRELQALINRTGLDRKTEDEVFDKTTLHILEKMISDGLIEQLDFPISTGKEGNVFRGITAKKKYVAVKIYRTNTSTFKHILQYIQGDPRFISFQKSRRGLVYAWTKKEFKNLERAINVGVKAPRPIFFKKNVLIMEYIGSSDEPAPLLKDIKLENPKKIYDTIIEFISKMYKKAALVHSDISAFNILMFKNNPYIIDFGQGVLLDHPYSDKFLRRDINNIINFFNKYNLDNDFREIYLEIINKKSNKK